MISTANMPSEDASYEQFLGRFANFLGLAQAAVEARKKGFTSPGTPTKMFEEKDAMRELLEDCTHQAQARKFLEAAQIIIDAV
jgi:hypothetical protein